MIATHSRAVGRYPRLGHILVLVSGGWRAAAGRGEWSGCGGGKCHYIPTRGHDGIPGERSTFRLPAVCHNSSSEMLTAKIERF